MAEFYENKNVSIMCPNLRCGKFLTKADSRDGRIHKLVCKNCKKWIWFKPNDITWRKIKDKPLRTQGSGVRFY